MRELLQRAGSRPPLPQADMAMIKAAARHEWEQLQEAGQRAPRWSAGRLLAMAAGLFVVVLAGWWWAQKGVPEQSVVIASVERSSHPHADLAKGSEILAGSRLGTRTPIALRLAGGQSLRIAAHSRLHLHSAFEVQLLQGAVYVDSGPGVGGEEVRIVTSHVEVREIGTQFEVQTSDVGESLRIRVRAGKIVVNRDRWWDPDQESQIASAGEELALRADGSVDRSRIPTFGDEWVWVEELASPIDLEQSTFGSYLDWLARETGWQIEFEDDRLRREAAEIVLYGSLGAATPRDSVETAFAVAGLRYKSTEGRLRVLRP